MSLIQATIRKRLSEGSTPKELTQDGWKKSTVYKVYHAMREDKTADPVLLRSAMKKLSKDELRVVFEVGALIGDPLGKELLKKLVEP